MYEAFDIASAKAETVREFGPFHVSRSYPDNPSWSRPPQFVNGRPIQSSHLREVTCLLVGVVFDSTVARALKRRRDAGSEQYQCIRLVCDGGRYNRPSQEARKFWRSFDDISERVIEIV